MSTTDTEHRHHFPARSDDGQICTSPLSCACGKTYPQDRADRLLADTLRALERAYGVPPRVSTHWAVHYGSENLNDGIGYVELRDDEEDARELVPYYKGGSVVKRTVIALRWETVPDEAKQEEAGR
jgi:hypothetical protein